VKPGSAVPVVADGGAGLGRDPEAEYFQGVEEYFVSLRGAPLSISNADWTLIRKWRAAGLPLRVVLRGIRDALDGHAHSWGRKRKVGSLAYCAAEVDAARARWHHALALGSEGTSAKGVLLEFADALLSAPLGGRGRPAAERIAAELAVWARQDEDTAALEPRLAGAEAALVAAIREDVGASAISALEAEIDDDLRAYRDRMPAKVLAQVRAGSLTRRILETVALPRLSLFHL
jgi:hypothetical protein